VEETFNNIEWERIESPGIEEDMLHAIRSLASDEKDIRLQALMDLFDRIWHQRTLSSSASFVTPFFIERLQQEPEPDLLEHILLDLAHLGTGNSYCDAYKDLSHYEDRRNTPEFQAQMEEELDWMRATCQTVYKGINLYLDFLEGAWPNVRIAAAYSLTCCHPEADKICNRMYVRFRYELEETVKVHLLLCLAILSNSTFVDPAFFQEVLNSDESDLVKLSAAVALADVAGKNLSDEALEILINLLNVPNLFSIFYDDFQSPMSTVHCLSVIDFLNRLNERQMAKVMPVLIKEWGLPLFVDDLTYLVFGQKKIPEGSNVKILTESQRFLLQAIADDESSWNHASNLIRSVLNDLGIHGVPLREKLIRFLNGERLKYDR
jgi:hypothetical protein